MPQGSLARFFHRNYGALRKKETLQQITFAKADFSSTLISYSARSWATTLWEVIVFERRSKAAFFAALLGLAYSIYSIIYWAGVAGQSAASEDAAVAIAGGLATILVFPHMLTTVLATIFAIIGFFIRKPGLILTGAILFSVAAVLFLIYAVFLIPSIVLGFVGYSKQKKMNAPAPGSAPAV